VINYLFIETREPFESRDVKFVIETAAALKQRDNEVTIFLVQNGVLAARRKATGSELRELPKSGIRLMADEFSLHERGILIDELLPGIHISNIDSVVDIIARENTRVIWH
jgi:predicted peroxiredoxin